MDMQANPVSVYEASLAKLGESRDESVVAQLRDGTSTIRAQASSDSAVIALATALRFVSTLQSLDLAGSAFGADGAESLADTIEALPGVLRVRLRGCPVGDEGAAAVVRAAARQGSAVTSLDLSRAGIGPRGASAVAGYVSVCPALRMLNLEENPLGAQAAGALAAAAFATRRLEVLGLARTGLGDAGARQLLAVFRPPMEGLPHEGVPSGGAGAGGDGEDDFGSESTRPVALRLLDLSANALGEAAARAAAEAIPSPRCGLRELVLAGNPLGKAGVDAVLRSVGEARERRVGAGRTLTFLDLSGCCEGVTSAAERLVPRSSRGQSADGAVPALELDAAEPQESSPGASAVVPSAQGAGAGVGGKTSAAGGSAHHGHAPVPSLPDPSASFSASPSGAWAAARAPPQPPALPTAAPASSSSSLSSSHLDRLSSLERAVQEVARAGREAHARAEAAEARAQAAEGAALEAQRRAQAAERALGAQRAGEQGEAGAAQAALEEVRGLTGRVDAALRGLQERVESREQEGATGGQVEEVVDALRGELEDQVRRMDGMLQQLARAVQGVAGRLEGLEEAVQEEQDASLKALEALLGHVQGQGQGQGQGQKGGGSPGRRVGH